MKRMSNRGDTIIEVLLAIAIVGSVLTGAFVAINRSMNASQQAQERSQATKLVEIQLERLKSITNNTTVDIFNTLKPRTLCLDTTVTRRDFPGSAIPLPSRDADLLDANPPGNYPANCIVDSAGNTYSGASNSIAFYVSLERDAANPNQFTGRARWHRAGGAGREEAAITYRVYP
jgi:prepilin-type N-terminal cleavage/methylation domain-containing protein